MTATDDANPWRLFERIWRSVFAAFTRLPFLVIGSLLLYTAVSAYWQHYMPLAIRHGVHPVGQVGYVLLHAAIFAPLMVGVVQQVVRGRVATADIWKPAIVAVGAIMALWELVILSLAWPIWLWRTTIPGMIGAHLYQAGWKFTAFLLYAAPAFLINLAVLLLSVRLALLLPVLVMEGRDWRSAVVQAWRGMRGSFCFALTASILALSPFMVIEFFALRLYRSLSAPTNFPVILSLREWEALLVRSAELALSYILCAALAAWLYRAIAARRARAIN